MQKHILIVSLFFYCFFLHGQIHPIVFIEYDLPNGLHVILHADKSTPVVAINIMYHVGSKDEPFDRTGFAHFFEHLMFEATTNIRRGGIQELINNAGGEFNAFTSFDKTVYYEILPSNQAALGLWIEAERMTNLSIDSLSVETQRNVIKEERKYNYENQPYGSFQEKIFSSVFTQHPYHWIPIGKVQYIDQAGIDEFQNFYNHFYTPANASLTVCGDIDIDSIKKIIDTYFGPINKTSIIKRQKYLELPKEKMLIDTVYDNIQIPAVFFTFPAPPAGGKDYYAMVLLKRLLADGQSSLLYTNIIDKKALAVDVAAYQYALEDTGLLLIYGLPNQQVSVDDIKNAIQAEIEKIKQTSISDYDLQKIINQTENSFYLQRSSMESIALLLGEYYTFHKNTSLINNEINKYMEVSKEDIKRVANTYLTNRNSLLLYYLPKNTTP